MIDALLTQCNLYFKLASELALNEKPRLTPLQVKQLYEEEKRRGSHLEQKSEVLNQDLALEPSALEKALAELKMPSTADQAHVINLLRRAYLGIIEKDYKIFIHSFERLRKVIEQYQPDSLSDEFLIFVADEEMWEWLSILKRREPTKDDEKYAYYLGRELYDFIRNENVFKLSTKD